MAQVIVTLKIMPESVEINLDELQKTVEEKIRGFGGEIGKAEQLPVAFGLKSLNITFFMDESKGDTEPLEKEISEIEEVQSCQVVDVRRAIG